MVEPSRTLFFTFQPNDPCRTCGYWSHSLAITLLQSMIPACLCSIIVGGCSRVQLRFAQKQKTTPTAAAPPPVGAEKK